MIKVLHLSTHNENCGIGKYQEMFLEEMSQSGQVYNEFFEYSPNKIKAMPKKQYNETFDKLSRQLKKFEVLHIQHEYSFFWQDELARAISIAKKRKKKVVVTVHTSANVGHKPAKLMGLGPRSWAGYLNALRIRKKMYKRFVGPLKDADKILVHNEVTRESLVSRGIDGKKISKITIPVPRVDHTVESSIVKNNLATKKTDVVFATVGFLHRYKGVKQAVKSLKYLPENYKLAILGGLHPGTDDIEIYDKISDLVVRLGLEKRVYISGYIEDDSQMNAAIRECDICVFPYDKEYYSNVSSAALNNAFANHRAVVAYPTESFKELNGLKRCLKLTDTFSYYELARELNRINIVDYKEYSRDFAETYSYGNVTKDLINHYLDLRTR